MDPQEVPKSLTVNNLQQLCMLAGLDTSNNVQHASLFGVFIDKSRERAAPISYKLLSANNRELFVKKAKSELLGPMVLLKSTPRGILKRHWPFKYLEDKPAVIACFVNTDLADQTTWPEKRTECESKINSLRQSIGQQQIRIFLVLLQQQPSVSGDDRLSAEKVQDLCNCCRLTPRQIFVAPSTSRPLDFVIHLERAFYDLAQEAYQAFLKKIRSRNVPNNNPYLLIAQQYKMAFISELRLDTHSALRFYKQAYQLCSEIDLQNIDAYEVLAVASLLNYKICELAFFHTTASDAISQIRRHESLFFSRSRGPWPSRELSDIEFSLWKSQQCRLFAELFNKSVNKGLVAYAFQNPGRFLEDSAFHLRSANTQIRRLRSNISSLNHQEQLAEAVVDGHLFDPISSTEFYGQRPYKNPAKDPLSSTSPASLDYAAKIYLERTVTEKYANSIQLLTNATSHFKKYNCMGMQNICFIKMAEDYICMHEFQKAHQLLTIVSSALRSQKFSSLLSLVLIRLLLTSFCLVDLNDYILTLVQLVHPEIMRFVEQIDPWKTFLQNFLSNNFCTLPIVLPCDFFKEQHHFLKENLDSATQRWQHLLATPPNDRHQYFDIGMSQIGEFSFLQCSTRFLVTNGDSQRLPKFGTVFSGDPLLVEVRLKNASIVDLQFSRCQVVLETTALNQPSSITLQDWLHFDGEESTDEQQKRFSFKNFPFQLSASSSQSLFFLTRPSLDSVDPSLMMHQAAEKYIAIRKVTLWTKNFSGSFTWEFDSPPPSSTIAVLPPRKITNDFSSSPFEYCCASLRIVPMRREFPFHGNTEGIKVFVNESVDCAFEVENNITDLVAKMKKLRVTSRIIYEEENVLGLSLYPLSMRSAEEEMILTGPSVQILDKEIASVLPHRQSARFSVTLQCNTTRFKCLHIKIAFLLEHEKTGEEECCEFQKVIPVKCTEAFNHSIKILSDDNVELSSVTNGDLLRVVLHIKPEPMKPLTIHSVNWNINDCLERVGDGVVSSVRHFSHDPFMGPKREMTPTEDDHFTHSIRLQVPPHLLTPNELNLGKCKIEWQGAGSSERNSTLVRLGTLPLIAVPFTLHAEILPYHQPNLMSSEGQFEELVLRKPFVIRFSFRNHTDYAISLHVIFESSEVFIFAGSKEFDVRIFNGLDRDVDQTYVALAAGSLPFPRLSIRCVDMSGPELDPLQRDSLIESTNRLIQEHTVKSLPQTLFIMVF